MTENEKNLIKWIGEEEFQQYGECYGKALDTLIAQGYVKIHIRNEHQSGFIAKGHGILDDKMYRAVSLTEVGEKVLSEMRSTPDA